MFNTVFQGGAVALWTDHQFDAGAIWRFVERQQINTVSLVGDAMGETRVMALMAYRAFGEQNDYPMASTIAIMMGVVELLDFLYSRHEPRELLELSPLVVNGTNRAIDLHVFFYSFHRTLSLSRSGIR